VDRLSKDPKFAKVAVYRVDYDSSKGLLTKWKVNQQGTVLAFKGAAEKARSVMEADEAALRKVFEASL
jgi:thioredoxin 1